MLRDLWKSRLDKVRTQPMEQDMLPNSRERFLCGAVIAPHKKHGITSTMLARRPGL